MYKIGNQEVKKKPTEKKKLGVWKQAVSKTAQDHSQIDKNTPFEDNCAQYTFLGKEFSPRTTDAH